MNVVVEMYHFCSLNFGILSNSPSSRGNSAHLASSEKKLDSRMMGNV